MSDLLDVCWTPALEEALRDLWLSVRHLPPVGDTSTPELVFLRLLEERHRADAFLRALRLLLTRSRAPALDDEVIEAIARLRDATNPQSAIRNPQPEVRL